MQLIVFTADTLTWFTLVVDVYTVVTYRSLIGCHTLTLGSFLVQVDVGQTINEPEAYFRTFPVCKAISTRVLVGHHATDLTR